MSAFAFTNGTASADQTDPRLEPLFEELQRAPGPGPANIIEEKIWMIWFETSDPEAASQMRAGIDAMNLGEFTSALNTFSQLIEIAPNFSEAWNRRATLHYLMNNLEESLADIEATLALEPRHFGALSGRGLVYIKMKEYDRAIAAFEEALAVSPQMTGPKMNIVVLRKLLKGREI